MVGDDIRDDVLGAQAAGFKVLFNTKANTVCMHVYKKIKFYTTLSQNISMKMYIIHTYLSYFRDV